MAKGNKPLSRRRFLKGTGVAAGAAASSLAAPAVLAQSPIVMKMQSSWPASDVFHEMAGQYAKIVEDSSGGRIKIDLTPAGAIVGAFQVMDGVNDGVIDAAHTVAVYWYGKHKGASFFGTGPVWGGSASTMLGWYYQGGGQDLYKELTQDILGLNVYGYYGMPMPAQPFGWFKKPVASVDDMQGSEVPHRRSGGRSHAGNGNERRPAARRRNRAGYGEGGHRRLRVQQPDIGHALRRPGRGKVLLPVVLPSGERGVRVHVQQGLFRRPRSGSPGDPGQQRPCRQRRQPRLCAQAVLDAISPSCKTRPASASSAPPRPSWTPSSPPGTS